MRILLTNDDGYHAEGFLALRAIAEQLISMTGGEIFACAPLVEQSGKGRGVTLTEPLRVT